MIQGKRTTVSYKNHKIINKQEKDWIKKEKTHDAIISNYLFNKVKIARLKRRKPLKYTGKIHPLAGKVVCLDCLHNMRKKNSSKHSYLVCANYECNNKKGIRYDLLNHILSSNLLVDKYITKIYIGSIISFKRNIYVYLKK